MPVSRFGERQYELAANLELLGGSGAFFVPTTPQEAQLGIDVAMAPGDRRIWELLGIRPPAGVLVGSQPLPGWQQTGEPPFLVSLFIQYKRSAYLTRSYAREWHFHQESYWRVELTSHQHQRLQDLETVVSGNAEVRYAAPKFWTYDEMWTHQATGGVLDNSLLVTPSSLANRHQKMTWSPTRGLIGHSRPEPLHAESSTDLARSVIERAARDPTPERREPRFHLDALAAAVEESELSRRSRDELHDEVYSALRAVRHADADEAEVRPLTSVAVVAEAANAARASWLVVAVGRRQSTEA